VPVGHVNHHFVCSLNPSQSYIDGLVANLVSGSTVNWFADVNGRGYLIGTGPMNHAGTGNSSVLNRTKSDQPPPSNPASSAGDISGNSHYSGTEAQHPGDSTPWPAPMLDIVVAINAAEFLVWGYSAARAINHSEWSNRKIDMSAGGGINSDGWSAAELRRRVADRMVGAAPAPEIEEAYGMTASINVNGSLNVFAVAEDGKVYQQWPDPGSPSGWSGWIAGVPGSWSGGLSVTAGSDGGFSLFGVDPDGNVCQVWTTPDGWQGPVPFTGITAL
jgi:hypothetical protein